MANRKDFKAVILPASLIIVNLFFHDANIRTVTLDILRDEAINLLKDLEALKIIRIQSDDEAAGIAPVNLALKYSGAMSKQSPEEIDKELNDLRNEWD
jgi:hypothetical protein